MSDLLTSDICYEVEFVESNIELWSKQYVFSSDECQIFLSN